MTETGTPRRPDTPGDLVTTAQDSTGQVEVVSITALRALGHVRPDAHTPSSP